MDVSRHTVLVQCHCVSLFKTRRQTFTLLSLHLSQPFLDFPCDLRCRRGSPFASASASERVISNCGSLTHWMKAFGSGFVAISCMSVRGITLVTWKAMLRRESAWLVAHPLKSHARGGGGPTNQLAW